jgi:hypothetical protein
MVLYLKTNVLLNHTVRTLLRFHLYKSGPGDADVSAFSQELRAPSNQRYSGRRRNRAENN